MIVRKLKKFVDKMSTLHLENKCILRLRDYTNEPQNVHSLLRKTHNFEICYTSVDVDLLWAAYYIVIYSPVYI